VSWLARTTEEATTVRRQSTVESAHDPFGDSGPMRCTRCDKLAVPQAVGLTDEGLVVFGWCVGCLEETGCHEIRVARSARHASTTLTLDPILASWPRSSPHRVASDDPRASPWNRAVDPRRTAIRIVAIGLGFWGLALFLTGGWLAIRSGFSRGDALGRGSPLLMMFGGGMTTAVAAALAALVRAPRSSKSLPTPWLKLAQVCAFVVALAILILGIARHDPRRDLVIVGLTALALTVSITARWWELRLKGLSPN
jgi:uncharacterized membrane protein YidH (DUF202 family)